MEKLPPSYTLPQFPRRVLDAIAAGNLTNSVKAKIIDVLYDQLSGSTGSRYLYPGDYARVGEMLVHEFKSLRDPLIQLVGQECASVPAGTWITMLKEKFREKRRGLQEAEVMAARAKFTTRAGPRPEQPPSRRVEPHQLPDDLGQTPDSIAEHQRHLAAEWRKEKAVRDAVVIDESMTRTKMSRRKLCAVSVPQAVLALYPMLADFQEVLLEGKRQFGINASLRRQEWLTDARTACALIHLRSRTTEAAKIVVRWIGDSVQPADEKHGVLFALPLLAKQDSPKFWIVVDSVVPTEFPTLLIETEEGRSPLVAYKSIAIYVMKQCLCYADSTTHVTIGEAIDALVIVSQLFNINYPPRASTSWRFVSEVVYGYPAFKKSTAGMAELSRIFGCM